MIDRRARNEEKVWLAIDTSSSTLALALLQQDKILGELHTHTERNHSILLVPGIQQLLESSELSMNDIGGIAVGVGPGSYTGVRIGATVGKTMAWAQGIPLVGVSSLEALAYGETERDHAAADGKLQWIVPLLNARRAQAYTGLFAWDGEEWQRQLPDRILPMADWAAELVTMQAMMATEAAQATKVKQMTQNARASGVELDGVENSGKSVLSRYKPDIIRFVGETEGFAEQIELVRQSFQGEVTAGWAAIRARNVGLLAQSKWARGEAEVVHDFVPNYAQMTEAEKKLSMKNL